jgi:hypothetical protein
MRIEKGDRRKREEFINNILPSHMRLHNALLTSYWEEELLSLSPKH